MLLKFTDEFLEQYHMKNISEYNDNYYKIPFTINCDGNDYTILRITCDEFSNEYNYSLCLDDDTLPFDDRYIAPSFAEGDYKLDLNNYSKDYIWY